MFINEIADIDDKKGPYLVLAIQGAATLELVGQLPTLKEALETLCHVTADGGMAIVKMVEFTVEEAK